MKRLAVALLCVLSVGGCGWMGWLGRDKPAQVPVAGQGDAAKSSSVLSLGAGQSEAKASPAPQTRPAPYEGYELVGGPKVVDAVALVVNGRSISVNDVLSPLRRQLKSIGASGELSAFVDAAKRIIKDELLRQVGMELVLAEAERILTDQEKDYLKQEVESRVHEMVVE